MTEKTMVADTLAGINGELVRYGEMITQTENQQLKQTLKQMRNQLDRKEENVHTEKVIHIFLSDEDSISFS